MVEDSIIDKIVLGLGNSGGTGNVMEYLGYTQARFDEAFMIANNIQNMDLVKLLYSNYNLSKVIVEFTLLGKARYENLIM
jgi:GTP cyclohydrolase III